MFALILLFGGFLAVTVVCVNLAAASFWLDNSDDPLLRGLSGIFFIGEIVALVGYWSFVLIRNSFIF